eukprot:1855611-Alexandrium_andersonii.AAC.1
MPLATSLLTYVLSRCQKIELPQIHPELSQDSAITIDEDDSQVADFTLSNFECEASSSCSLPMKPTSPKAGEDRASKRRKKAASATEA